MDAGIMPDLEKAICGVECCLSRESGFTECARCPYRFPIGIDGTCENLIPLFRAILPVLKAQVPRVMTLEEAKNADHCFCEAGSLFVCRIVPVPDGWVTIQQFGRPDMEIDSNEYGIAFRCWTSRPTEEQREAVTWE